MQYVVLTRSWAVMSQYYLLHSIKRTLLARPSWWGINTSDFILETSAPSISPKPIVNLQGTNSQGREAPETKGLGTNVFLPKMDFLGIPYNIKQLISP